MKLEPTFHRSSVILNYFLTFNRLYPLLVIGYARSNSCSSANQFIDIILNNFRSSQAETPKIRSALIYLRNVG
jgi:hypothetical protein